MKSTSLLVRSARVACAIVVATASFGCARDIPKLDDSQGGLEADGDAGVDAPLLGPIDTELVETPDEETSLSTARFVFRANQADAKFECKLDENAPMRCGSPYGYFGLPAGRHTFTVQASLGIDVDTTPATFSWVILGTTGESETEVDPPRGPRPGEELEPNDDDAHATDLGAPNVEVRGAIGGDDVDVFRITLQSRSSLRVEVAGGLGQPCTADSELVLVDEGGAELARDDDDGEGGCSLLQPSLDEGMRSLPAGTYFARVTVRGERGAYRLKVTREVACGDGVLDPGELCDDSNNADGDGCNARCRIEVEGEESEPNNDLATATSIDAPGVLRGAVSSGDIDDFRFVLARASSVRVFVSSVDDEGACPGDTLVDLLDASGAVLATDDDDGQGSCSLLDPSNDLALRSLPAGAYAARVRPYAGGSFSYAVHVVVVDVCGDALLQNFETCDDGNATAGDGCSPRCSIEPRCGDGEAIGQEECDDGNTVDGDGCTARCTFERDEVEPNNDSAHATDLLGRATVSGALAPVGDVDLWKVTLAAPSGLRIFTTSREDDGLCPGDTFIDIEHADGTLIASDDDDGLNFTCSLLDPGHDPLLGSLPAGDLYIRVRTFSSSRLDGYALHVEVVSTCGDAVREGGETCDDGNLTAGDGCDAACVREPRCGDGIREAGELCDDHNLVDGDGCSATCTAENEEREPNNTQGTATPLPRLDATVAARFDASSDVDYFSFTLTRPAEVAIETMGVGGPNTCPADMTLTLFNAMGAQLAFDDDSGFDLCSLIAPARSGVLPAGTYAVLVKPYGTGGSLPRYLLSVSITSSCGDGALNGTEACDDGNDVDDDGCTNRCTLDEQEPNNTRAQANLLSDVARRFSGSLPPGDEDYLRFRLPNASSVVIEIGGTEGRAACPGDTVLALFDVEGRVLARDDQSGVDDCARLDPTSAPEVATLPAGDYVLRVSAFTDVPIPVYRVFIDATRL